MNRRIWFDRNFSLGMSGDALPDVVERLRGTPLRLEERTQGLPQSTLTTREDGRWSIQEHVGHLADLEPLWLGRLEDFARGEATLRATDLQNRATWDANHAARKLADILREFRERRMRLIERLGTLTSAELSATAAHPRLRQPMTVTDHCFFVAEHDDHHLAAITELRRVIRP